MMEDNCDWHLSQEQYASCFYDSHPWIIWVKVACFFLAFLVPVFLLWKRPPNIERLSTVALPPVIWAYFMFIALMR